MSDGVFAAQGTNAAEYSVSELSGALRRTVEDAFGNVRVRGEISGYRGAHASGHAYFTLKDDRARLDAVIWRATFAKLAFRPEEGLEVIAIGRLTTYPGSSKYQIVIDDLKPAGAGALMALLNERRLKLEAEGLFDTARKRALPFMPRVIGIVTSPTGAVIRDICHRIADRFPVHLLVWPVRVQGETSGAEVAAAIEGFNAIQPGGKVPRPDLIIVARGGGSLEDLWGFNDEAVVRAAAASAIPLVSAVGHETDWTLIDHAADRRAPTPTGAAEMAVPVRAELTAQVAALHARLRAGISRQLQQERRALVALARAMPGADMLLATPRRRLDDFAVGLERGLTAYVTGERRRFLSASARLQPGRLAVMIGQKRAHLTELANRSAHAISGRASTARNRFSGIAAGLRPSLLDHRLDNGRRRLMPVGAMLQQTWERAAARRAERLAGVWRVAASLDPRRVLERGYAIIRDTTGQAITRADGLTAGQRFSVEFAGGESREAMALDGKAAAARPRRTAGADKVEQGKPEQGKLF
ncbi:exodeoxyribonuclease VII large subunit [Aureimonas altamirensis]|uniref:Exodeoxyribonuclease 7 large subunit n=1 Tax=Aureimonas altamirensis TaxID=370622 RepID=A0A0B1Q5J7_9HYPH|nr:exodeoxyribonuclease VII large subunit [Aureimonas altamirensis]KHJ55659.1 exodeoxyribonuclease VII large subunit [Aureimonas altamirensis]